jgi:hypothetical protein
MLQGHGGSISLKSAEKGAAFEIRLPSWISSAGDFAEDHAHVEGHTSPTEGSRESRPAKL